MSVKKTITYKGKTQCILDWSLELGISTNTIYSRLRKGWPVEGILSYRDFNFCNDIRLAKRLEKIKSYPTDKHQSKNLDSNTKSCCTSSTICKWAIAITDWEDIKDDPSKGNYYCKLIERFVAGDSPVC